MHGKKAVSFTVILKMQADCHCVNNCCGSTCSHHAEQLRNLEYKWDSGLRLAATELPCGSTVTWFCDVNAAEIDLWEWPTLAPIVLSTAHLL